MTAQIIPFQTKGDRMLALARSWYRNIKENYAKQGLIIDREKLIEEAVVEARVEEWMGRRYWEKPGMETDSEYANSWRKIARRQIPDMELLRLRLDECLHGKWQRMKAVAPRRPRRWKPKIDVPIARIIPFPTRCPEEALKSATK